MIKIDLEKISSVAEIRNALLPLTDADAGSTDNYDFSWLNPIISSSLDTYVLWYLNVRPPSSNAFVALDLDEHMTEARNLINEANSIRSEIFAIESQAIGSTLEYLQLLTSMSANKKLGKLSLKATYAQSNEQDDKLESFETALDENFHDNEQLLRLRFSFHNQPGNPLNFGERVGYLRDIYCDNVKNIYERLIAIKRTLKYSFNQDTESLPNYVEVSNNLNGLVKWMRTVIYSFERKAQYDYFLQKTVTLASVLSVKGVDAAGIKEYFKKFADDGLAFFDITDRDLSLNPEYQRVRVLGLSVNVIGYWEWVDQAGGPAKQNIDYATRSNREIFRENQLFQCELRPPGQKIGLNEKYIFGPTAEEKEKAALDLGALLDATKKGKLVSPSKIPDFSKAKFKKNPNVPGGIEISWEPPQEAVEDIFLPDRLCVGDIQPIYRSSVNTNLNFFSDTSVRNIVPFGKWTIWLKSFNYPRPGEGANSNIVPAAPVRLDDPAMGIRDVALTFRLGARRIKI